MDFSRWGIVRRPFRSAPDLEAYCPCQQHEAVRSQLLDALMQQEGFAVVSGDVGLGKTLLVLKFLSELVNQHNCVFIGLSRFESPVEMYQAILFDLSLPYAGLNLAEARLALQQFLMQQLQESRQTCIVLDDAGDLDEACLLELQALSELVGPDSRAAFFLLVDRGGLLARISESLPQLHSRLIVKAVVNPLSHEESMKYIRHHLRVAGARPEVLLTDEALSYWAEQGAGNPRRLNQLGLRSLQCASAHHVETIDVEVVMEAAEQLGVPLVDRPEMDYNPARLKLSGSKKAKRKFAA